MIEKPRHGSRYVKRRKLVQQWRQPRRVEQAGSPIAGCQNHGKAKLPKLFDEWREDARLRGVCRMEKSEGAAGPLKRRPTEPLAAPRKIVAAKLSPPEQI